MEEVKSNVFTTDFDCMADTYEALHRQNTKSSGYSTSYFAEYKVKEVAGHLKEIGWAGRGIRVLNFGCGIGNSEAYIRKYLPTSLIYSVDVSRKSVEYARHKNKDLQDVYFSVFDGRVIPFDVAFDVIFVANVIHHVPREQHAEVLSLLNHSLRPSGLLFLFEHNPLNPLTVKAVRECPLDKGILLLSPSYTRRLLSQVGFCETSLRFTLFFPGFLSTLTPMERYLRKCPLGAQYYFIAKKRDALYTFG